MKATIFDIERNSYVDGPGIRTTIFFKGCNLRCAWCHNPESQSKEPQMMFYKNRCTSCGKCKEKCPNTLAKCTLCGKCTLYCPNDAREICGMEYSVDDVMHEIVKDTELYESSGGGVTLSGGECMLQIDFLIDLLIKCKECNIHTAIDTAGHIPFEYFERIIPYTDLFLFDVKTMDTQKHETYTGKDNELILENLKRLLKSNVNVWIRMPIIAGVNDCDEEIIKLKKFISLYGQPAKIELLPYHSMGEHKYAAIGKISPKFIAPTKEKLKYLESLL